MPFDPVSREALIDLLLDLYRLRMSDLAWTLSRVPDTQGLADYVTPPDTTPPRVYARQVVTFLEANGTLAQQFFDALVGDRPRREPDIRAIQRRGCGIVLVLCAGETGVEPLDVAGEVREIKEAIRRSFGDSLWQVKAVMDVPRDGWVREVEQTRPTILHFAGHGTVESWLIDVEGVVPHGPLERLVRASPGLELVFLNACSAANAAKALAKGGVPWAIGHQQPVADDAAKKFASGFYGKLARGGDVGASFRAAMEALDWNDYTFASKPTLYPGPNT